MEQYFMLPHKFLLLPHMIKYRMARNLGKFLSQNIWRAKFWQINKHLQFYLMPFDVEVTWITRNAVYICGGICGTWLQRI